MSLEISREAVAAWRADPARMVRDLWGIEPDAWQLRVLRAFPTEPRIAMKAPISVFEMVPTSQGLMRWGDVRVGSYLFADDGSLTKVVRCTETRRAPLFSVTLRDGASMLVTADHQWDVETPHDRKIGARRTVSTAQLLVTQLKNAVGQRLVSLPLAGPAQFPLSSQPADPYTFGLWLGDGVANEARLICPDPAIRLMLVQRNQPISENASSKRIGLVGFIKALRATGMSDKRSYEKSIPDVYKFASVEQRLDLLRGLMDSDGTCATNGHCYLASSSEVMIDDFIWLARSLGFLATKMGPYRTARRDSFRAVICGNLCPFLADTPKRQRWRAPAEHKTQRFIDSVEPAGEGEAMCVEVDHPSHCFQATDFMVTHNCKGPGKTAVLAWLCWNFLLTRPHPNIGAISITGDQLKTGLWKEMSKWHGRSPLLESLFSVTAETIALKAAPKTWFMAAKSWSQSADKEEQAAALAGLHEDYIMFVLDESGGMPDAVMASAEAALASCKEGHILQAGNPTHLDGPLYRASTSDRANWWVIEITGDPDSPERSPRISIEWAKQQIATYGRDNPWVKINVFGEFPAASLNALIGPDEVSAAMRRVYTEYDFGKAPRIIGVDVARQGDDTSVICVRQGLQLFKGTAYRNLSSDQGAGQVARKWDEVQADAVFVDASGGHGWGWIDQLRLLGRAPLPVEFAGAAHQPERYYNKRAEMYADAVQWIRSGGALPPNSSEILAALTKTTYSFKGDRILLEPKDAVKAKIGYSPDEADAFVLTFAEPVVAAARTGPGRHQVEYDPYPSMDRHRSEYDAYRS